MAHSHKKRKEKHYAHSRHMYGSVSIEDLLAQAQRITKEELKELIDEGKNPLVIDVRGGRAYQEATTKIKGSVRVPPSQVHTIIDELPNRNRPIVFY